MEEKICIGCALPKSLDNFGKYYRTKDGLQNKCKSCKQLYDNDFYNKKTKEEKSLKYVKQVERLKIAKEFIIKFLSNKNCVKCSENRMPALDFHHLRDKKFNISDGIKNGYSLDRIKKEIDKCEIMCSNCHRVETAETFNWYTNM